MNFLNAYNHKVKLPIVEYGNFLIKLVENKSELKSAQSLRYSVFYKERGAKSSLSKKILKRDYDNIDQFAHHLIVIDKTKKKSSNQIVGTYRLLKGDLARQVGGFYTSSEFDLSNIINIYRDNQILELGRSCIHKDYRNRNIISLIWKVIALYINLYDIKILFGCVSFPGIDVLKFSEQLSYLKDNFSLPSDLSVKSLYKNIFSIDKPMIKKLHTVNTFVKLPPLIKGYLRIGGKVSDSYFVDHQFNTIDLCVVVKIESIDHKYKKKYFNQQVKP